MENTIFIIDEEEKEEAKALTQSFVKTDVRSRAYANALGSEICLKYLRENNILNEKTYNMHNIRKILEEFDISDIILSNIHIDVRVVYNENEIFIPKSHFDYNLTPDIYVVLKISKNYSDTELLGFFEPKMLNKNNANGKYYFIEKEKLSSPLDLKSYIENHQGSTSKDYSDDELEKAEFWMISMADHSVSEADKKKLLECLKHSSKLRDRFIEFENFEMLAYQAVNVVGLDRKTKEELAIENLTEDDIVEEAPSVDEAQISNLNEDDIVEDPINEENSVLGGFVEGAAILGSEIAGTAIASAALTGAAESAQIAKDAAGATLAAAELGKDVVETVGEVVSDLPEAGTLNETELSVAEDIAENVSIDEPVELAEEAVADLPIADSQKETELSVAEDIAENVSIDEPVELTEEAVADISDAGSSEEVESAVIDEFSDFAETPAESPELTDGTSFLDEVAADSEDSMNIISENTTPTEDLLMEVSDEVQDVMSDLDEIYTDNNANDILDSLQEDVTLSDEISFNDTEDNSSDEIEFTNNDDYGEIIFEDNSDYDDYDTPVVTSGGSSSEGSSPSGPPRIETVVHTPISEATDLISMESIQAGNIPAAEKPKSDLDNVETLAMDEFNSLADNYVPQGLEDESVTTDFSEIDNSKEQINGSANLSEDIVDSAESNSVSELNDELASIDEFSDSDSNLITGEEKGVSDNLSDDFSETEDLTGLISDEENLSQDNIDLSEEVELQAAETDIDLGEAVASDIPDIDNFEETEVPAIEDVVEDVSIDESVELPEVAISDIPDTDNQEEPTEPTESSDELISDIDDFKTEEDVSDKHIASDDFVQEMPEEHESVAMGDTLTSDDFVQEMPEEQEIVAMGDTLTSDNFIQEMPEEHEVVAMGDTLTSDDFIQEMPEEHEVTAMGDTLTSDDFIQEMPEEHEVAAMGDTLTSDDFIQEMPEEQEIVTMGDTLTSDDFVQEMPKEKGEISETNAATDVSEQEIEIEEEELSEELSAEENHSILDDLNDISLMDDEDMNVEDSLEIPDMPPIAMNEEDIVKAVDTFEETKLEVPEEAVVASVKETPVSDEDETEEIEYESYDEDQPNDSLGVLYTGNENSEISDSVVNQEEESYDFRPKSNTKKLIPVFAILAAIIIASSIVGLFLKNRNSIDAETVIQTSPEKELVSPENDNTGVLLNGIEPAIPTDATDMSPTAPAEETSVAEKSAESPATETKAKETTPEKPSVTAQSSQTVTPAPTTPAPKKPLNASKTITLKKVSWEVPDYLSYSNNIRTYLQAAGKSIKLTLSSDLLLTNEYIYSNQVKVSLKLTSDGTVESAQITKSSGSNQVDKIVLQTVKETLNVVKPARGEVPTPNYKLGLIIYL